MATRMATQKNGLKLQNEDNRLEPTRLRQDMCIKTVSLKAVALARCVANAHSLPITTTMHTQQGKPNPNTPHTIHTLSPHIPPPTNESNHPRIQSDRIESRAIFPARTTDSIKNTLDRLHDTYTTSHSTERTPTARPSPLRIESPAVPRPRSH